MLRRRRQPDFDIDVLDGQQAELFVINLQQSLAGSGAIEVKAPKPWLREESFFVEYQCQLKNGWAPSGIAITKAKLWFIKAGSLPIGLVAETEWLKRAARHAYKLGHKKECMRGSHPTRGVVVSLKDFWETREHDP